jgi:hypothetical protein
MLQIWISDFVIIHARDVENADSLYDLVSITKTYTEKS